MSPVSVVCCQVEISVIDELRSGAVPTVACPSVITKL